jgi:signal transduction histidine kinase
MIEADARQLSHVFIHLFLNAVEAMDAGGILTVIAAPLGGHRVDISVTDTGDGIRSEWLPKLFDPFFTTKHGGTGLGLAIAHRILESHGGTVRVASETGRGTTFTVTLPMIPVASETVAA